MKKILELKDVNLIYHTKEAEIEALKNISFSLNEGEFISIVGPSGCGKTTILSLVAGLLKPTKGNILIDGKNELKESTGYMFQKDHLFEWRNIYKNITIGLEVKHDKDQKKLEKIDELLKKYDLFDFKFKYPSQLSGGMRQRVSLIRTLALDPKILLLDEPFSALDFQTRLKVCDDVKNIILSENKTAILVTHDISEAISMADKVIVLSNRPATVKKIVSIDIDEKIPLKRREDSKFAKYFDEIWKELH